MKMQLNYHEAVAQKNGYVKIHVEDLNSITLYLAQAEERLQQKGRPYMAKNANELFWKLSDLIDSVYCNNEHD